MIAALILHISVDERGVAYLTGTRMKVQQIAYEKFRQGRTPEQIQAEHAHLSMAQIYAALT